MLYTHECCPPGGGRVAAFYMDTKGPHMMLDQVVRASKQVVAGMNYKMTLHFHELILCGTPMPYECTVTIYEDFRNVRSVSDEQCHMMQVPMMLSEC